MAAFQRATGERLDVDFSNKSSGQVKKVYDRMLIISKKLMAWLDRHLQRYDQLQEEIRKADKDPKQKVKAAELRKELERDKDLAALDTLIRIYSRPTIDTWKAYGIITIPPEVIDALSDHRSSEPRPMGR